MQIVTSWMEEGIQQGLQLANLEEFGEALLDFSTAADLTAWLQRNE